MNWRQRKKAAKDLRRRLERAQQNVMFETTIQNSKGANDVFWNGPIGGSKVQRVGILIFAFCMFGTFFAVAFGGKEIDLIFVLLGAFGMVFASRLAYVAIRGRKKL